MTDPLACLPRDHTRPCSWGHAAPDALTEDKGTMSVVSGWLPSTKAPFPSGSDSGESSSQHPGRGPAHSRDQHREDQLFGDSRCLEPGPGGSFQTGAPEARAQFCPVAHGEHVGGGHAQAGLRGRVPGALLAGAPTLHGRDAGRVGRVPACGLLARGCRLGPGLGLGP